MASEMALLTRTTNREFRLLGVSGQLTVQAYDQLNHHLKRSLGEDHAALLAEPNFDPEKGSIEWYAPAGDSTVRLQDLDPAAQEAAKARLATLVEDIERHAGELSQSTRSRDRFLADVLRQAIQIPSLDYVYVANGAPVLVAWAHTPTGSDGDPGMLMRLVSAPRTPPRIGPAERFMLAGRTWLNWPAIVSALLLLLLPLGLWYWFGPQLLAHFAIAAPQCHIDTAQLAALDDVSKLQFDEQQHRLELASVLNMIGDKRVTCPPPPAPPRAPDNDQKRVLDQGGQAGELQISLAWDDTNDLDLSVKCPSGEAINFRYKKNCGGTLDVDANLGNDEQPIRHDPVENIVWPDQPPSGHYVVYVRSYRQRDKLTSPYRLSVRLKGQPPKQIDGTISPAGGAATVYQFDLP